MCDFALFIKFFLVEFSVNHKYSFYFFKIDTIYKIDTIGPSFKI